MGFVAEDSSDDINSFAKVGEPKQIPISLQSLICNNIYTKNIHTKKPININYIFFFFFSRTTRKYWLCKNPWSDSIFQVLAKS